MVDDRELLEALAGQRLEWGLTEAMRRYGGMVLRAAWRVTRDEHHAEDVRQAAFYLLVRKARQSGGVRMLGPWLYQAAVSLAINLVKAEARRRAREQEAAMRSAAAGPAPTSLPSGVDEVICSLSEADRQLIVARYFEGRGYPEIARRLGVSLATAQKRAERAMTRLRARLQPVGLGAMSVAAISALLAREGMVGASLPMATTAEIGAIVTGAVAGGASAASALAKAAVSAAWWARVKVYAVLVGGAVAAAGPVTLAAQHWLHEDGLVGAYSFEEGGGKVVRDQSGQANHGTLTGGVVYAPGRKGQGLRFDGRSGYVLLDRDLNPWLGQSATVAFWVRTTQSGGRGLLHGPAVLGVEVNDPASPDIIWGGIDQEGRIGVIAGADDPEAGVRTRAKINDGAWRHIAMTREADTGRVVVYVDGRLDASGRSGPGVMKYPFRELGRHRERNADGPATDHYFQGDLDEVRFWGRILSPDEISRLTR